MKKHYKYIIGTTIFASIFTAGSFVGAQAPDFWTQISQDAAKTIGDAGKAKRDELTANIQAEVQQKIKDNISTQVQAKANDMQAKLQDYFNSHVNNLTNTTQYQAAVSDLDRIETNLLAGYEHDIDVALSGQ